VAVAPGEVGEEGERLEITETFTFTPDEDIPDKDKDEEGDEA
jgi:hypothetical protein